MFHCGPFFLVFLTKCLWNYPSCKKNLPCPEKFMFACMHSGIITFAKRFILNVWQCFEYVSVSIAFLCLLSILNSNLMCYVLLQKHSEFWHIPNPVYSGICWHIQAFSALLRHIRAYSGIFITLCNPCVFTTLPYSEPRHI